ncbi:GDP-mannose 4,6-dehydratase [Methylobacterium nodulans]|uniref:NAD-dependent epimerase/dehydratase n=1 Tax=Methylobacterium nodulans (strain LMG 21967 / CNCM I-2342 / ORS 2060) TaxID=460265 RepID=B8IAD3_METNO|nr:GDP-mannose 4,6-dehydratase [Methylobacterium nodulans]ACL59196.1 NAD-dependent epimerase/dehydratase [Methylobacterium nodulans ORS 2060]
MKNKRILITGAGGFIGSHLAEEAVRRGAEVTALLHYNAARDLANLADADPDLTAGMRIVFGDVNDPEFVLSLVEGQEIVLHLAALIAIPYSYTAPRSYVRTNIEGTLNVLEAARRVGVERVVHTSTSEVYGTAQYVPIDEVHPLQGQSPYSASKIGADKVAESYYRSFDVPVVTVRPFNTYGPRQSARAFIPTVIGQALRGGEIKLGATSPVRDLTFVADTAAGFLAAATTPGLEGGTYNLGVGSGQSVGEVAEMILRLMGSSARIVTDIQRLRPEKSEVGRLVSDNRRFFAASGWAPAIKLEEGLARTIDFFRRNPNRRDADTYVV